MPDVGTEPSTCRHVVWQLSNSTNQSPDTERRQLRWQILRSIRYWSYIVICKIHYSSILVCKYSIYFTSINSGTKNLAHNKNRYQISVVFLFLFFFAMSQITWKAVFFLRVSFWYEVVNIVSSKLDIPIHLQWELNSQPLDFSASALTTELWRNTMTTVVRTSVWL